MTGTHSGLPDLLYGNNVARIQKKFGSLPVKRGQTGDSSVIRANNSTELLSSRIVSESHSFPCVLAMESQ